MRNVNDELLITFTDYWLLITVDLIRIQAILSRDPGDGTKKESILRPIDMEVYLTKYNCTCVNLKLIGNKPIHNTNRHHAQSVSRLKASR